MLLRPALNLLRLVAILLLLKVVGVTLFSFVDYFPPNFRNAFLYGREGYFYGPYQWAFGVHVVTGPLTLVIGLLLMSSTLRQRYLKFHRQLGRLQVATVLLLLVPSGLWMAPYAATGRFASIGLALLAIATGYTAWRGWRAALCRQFVDHRRWMTRCFVLLCSAVLLRILGGIAETFALEGMYPWAIWASWVVPLVAWEVGHEPLGRSIRQATTPQADLPRPPQS